MKGGYQGRILKVDLSSGSSHTIEVREDLAGRYIGGKGFGARFLYDLVGPEVDPLAPASVLMFETGGDTRFLVYQKDDHEPAGYTVLNFDVPDIENTVDMLAGKGVAIEQLEGTNEKGIAEMGSVRAAWLKDPAGNWLGLFQRL